MIRELFGWARWVWSRQETWQKWWFVGMFFVGAAINAQGRAQEVCIAISVAIFGVQILKWMVWDAFKSSWAKYREERNSLLTTIKDSDH